MSDTPTATLHPNMASPRQHIPRHIPTLLALLLLLLACAATMTRAELAGVQSMAFDLFRAPANLYPAGRIYVQDHGYLSEFGTAMTATQIYPCAIWGPLYIPNAGSATIGLIDGRSPFQPRLENTTALHAEEVLAVPAGWPFFIMNPTSHPITLIGYHKFSTVNSQDKKLEFTYLFGGSFFLNYFPPRQVANTYNVTRREVKEFLSKRKGEGIVFIDQDVCAANVPKPRVLGGAKDGGVEGDFILYLGNASLALAQVPGAGFSRDGSENNFPELALIGVSVLYPTLKPVILNGLDVEPAGNAVVVPPSYVHQPRATNGTGMDLLSFFNIPETPTIFFTSELQVYTAYPTVFKPDILAAAFGTSVDDFLHFFTASKQFAIGLEFDK
eukprot:jgi/Chlat1/410/Chrsp10S08631